MDESQNPALSAVVLELRRIFADDLNAQRDRSFLMLPLVGDNDALAFLRQVPSGTRWEDLVALANAWREAHPLPLSIDP